MDIDVLMSNQKYLLETQLEDLEEIKTKIISIKDFNEQNKKTRT